MADAASSGIGAPKTPIIFFAWLAEIAPLRDPHLVRRDVLVAKRDKCRDPCFRIAELRQAWQNIDDGLCPETRHRRASYVFEDRANSEEHALERLFFLVELERPPWVVFHYDHRFRHLETPV
jgi:hypothetical protein